MIFHTKYNFFQTKPVRTMSNNISRHKIAIQFATGEHHAIN